MKRVSLSEPYRRHDVGAGTPCRFPSLSGTPGVHTVNKRQGSEALSQPYSFSPSASRAPLPQPQPRASLGTQADVAHGTMVQLISCRVINSIAGLLALEKAKFARDTLLGSSFASKEWAIGVKHLPCASSGPWYIGRPIFANLWPASRRSPARAMIASPRSVASSGDQGSTSSRRSSTSCVAR